MENPYRMPPAIAPATMAYTMKRHLCLALAEAYRQELHRLPAWSAEARRLDNRIRLLVEWA